MTDDNAEFGIVRPFGIDDGELDGLTPQEVFVLGYELAQIDHRLENEPGKFSMMIHSENQDRALWNADKQGRAARVRWMANDISEQWATLEVEAK